MRIYLIRHARQNSTLCNVNVKLSEEGIRQAHLLGERMKKYEIEEIYSSDLLRAVETADIMASHCEGIPHKIREELREIDFGDLTGHSDEYNNEHYGDFLEQRKELKEDISFPNGENGAQVFQRAIRAIEEITASGKKRVAVVTHGGTIRSLITGILHMEQANKLLFAQSLENCSITELIYDRKRKRYYLERFNDYSHLEIEPELLRNHWNKEGLR